MMLLTAPLLVTVFAVTIPLSALFTRWLTHKVQPLFRARSKKLGELNGFVEEVVSGQKTTKAYCCEEAILARFEEKNAAAADAYTEAESYGTITGPSVNFMNNLSLSLVSVFGAFMYMNGVIASVGGIASFVLYSRKFSGPINEIANVLSEFQSALAPPSASSASSKSRRSPPTPRTPKSLSPSKAGWISSTSASVMTPKSPSSTTSRCMQSAASSSRSWGTRARARRRSSTF